MALQLSIEEARNFLVAFHLTRTDTAGVIDRLGSVQYDPLNPVGRNIDLVFQARVPDYRVDDWQQAAYVRRLMYDSWDKQACLVPIGDWPHRALIRSKYHPWHDREILAEHPESVAAVLAEIDARGPMSSLEFEDRTHAVQRHSWYGLGRVKRILRALWAHGDLVTHHRESGRHYYDRPVRVIPAEHLNAPLLRDEDAYHRWIMDRRHLAAGLLRPRASAEIWSACGPSATRLTAIDQLVECGELVPVSVGEKGLLYHMPARLLPLLERAAAPAQMVFLGPLDNLVWDRQTVRNLFGFDYIWEVYKKPELRLWGYYVLPVLFGDRFIGRIESRLTGKTWTILRWWWEDDVIVSLDHLEALRLTARRFADYLRADNIEVPDDLDLRTRSAFSSALDLPLP